MPLVAPLPADHDEQVRELAEFFHETLGFIPNSVLTMQRRPAIARAFMELNKAVMESRHGVSSELKRLIGHLASSTAGCNYCEAHTLLAAKRYGASEERLAAIADYAAADVFSEAEKAAFDFAVAAAAIPNGVGEEIAENLRRHWDDGQIVEILGVVSLFGFLNRWNDSMATTLEDNACRIGEDYLAGRGWGRGKHR